MASTNRYLLGLLAVFLCFQELFANPPEVEVQTENYIISGNFFEYPGVTLEWVEKLKRTTITELQSSLFDLPDEKREDARLSLFQGQKRISFWDFALMGQLLRRSRYESILSQQSEISAVTLLSRAQKYELINPPMRDEVLAAIDDANINIKRCLEMCK